MRGFDRQIVQYICYHEKTIWQDLTLRQLYGFSCFLEESSISDGTTRVTWRLIVVRLVKELEDELAVALKNTEETIQRLGLGSFDTTASLRDRSTAVGESLIEIASRLSDARPENIASVAVSQRTD